MIIKALETARGETIPGEKFLCGINSLPSKKPGTIDLLPDLIG